MFELIKFLLDYHKCLILLKILIMLTSSINNVLHLPKPNTEIFKSSLHYRGSHLWNNLPILLKIPPL